MYVIGLSGKLTCRLLIVLPMLISVGALAQTGALIGKYNGAGSCAASSCHGSVQPRTNTRIPQNEYTIWIGQDRHTRAYSVLSNPVSVRIGRILNIGSPNQSPKCLVCHALYVGPEQRAQTFDINDGVSCENCHGPASGWLGPHTSRDWPHEKSLQLGMYDERDLVKRSEKCLTCHLGTADKFVDHEMIAAGHPDLTFELEFFSRAMPRHWTERQDEAWRRVQAVGVGEGVQLREVLNRVARRANGEQRCAGCKAADSEKNAWPEYAELECFACHHSLTATLDSWRQERGYPGRRPGNATWNQSRYLVFKYMADAINPDTAKQLSDEVSQFAVLMDLLNGNREQIATRAMQAASLSDQLVRQINGRAYDDAFTLRLLRRMARDGSVIAYAGERSAEQAAMTLDSLFSTYEQNVRPANAAEVRAAIGALLQQLDSPSAYSAPRFAAQLQRLSNLLGPP